MKKLLYCLFLWSLSLCAMDNSTMQNNSVDLLASFIKQNYPNCIDYSVGFNVYFFGDKLLNTAIQQGKLTIIKLLLMNNIKLNMQYAQGQTFLHHAAYKGRQDIVRTLIVGGADPRIKDYNGTTPYDIQFWGCMCAGVIFDECSRLFKKVSKNKDIQFTYTGGWWISRRHMRDTEGNNLLYYALLHNNNRVSKKLFALWGPELLVQPNFESETILDLLPVQSMLLLAKQCSLK